MAMARNPPSPLTKVTVASSIREMQSQRTFPSGVHKSSARCPMANLGVVPMPMIPGSYWRNPLWCEILSLSSVVHDWPSGGMNWRSSLHTGQWAGGASLGGYCVPQVEQMKACMVSSFGYWTQPDQPNSGYVSICLSYEAGSTLARLWSVCAGKDCPPLRRAWGRSSRQTIAPKSADVGIGQKSKLKLCPSFSTSARAREADVEWPNWDG